MEGDEDVFVEEGVGVSHSPGNEEDDRAQVKVREKCCCRMAAAMNSASGAINGFPFWVTITGFDYNGDGHEDCGLLCIWYRQHDFLSGTGV